MGRVLKKRRMLRKGTSRGGVPGRGLGIQARVQGALPYDPRTPYEKMNGITKLAARSDFKTVKIDEFFLWKKSNFLFLKSKTIHSKSQRDLKKFFSLFAQHLDLKEGPILAGGSLFRAFCGSHTSSDFDIFCMTLAQYQKMKALLATMGTWFHHKPQMAGPYEVDNYKVQGLHIQVVFQYDIDKIAKDIVDRMLMFDLHNSMMFSDGVEICFKKSGIKASNLKKVAKWKHSWFSSIPLTTARKKKYMELVEKAHTSGYLPREDV